MYQVKEIYYTIQGEGAQTGSPAVFCRFTGCNLWSGREEDRNSATCQFCDTDFVGTDGPNGGSYHTATELCAAIVQQWQGGDENRLVVFTGGEPLLQLDTALIDALHTSNVRVAVETNGTLPPPPGLDWICVSPKAGAEWVCRSGHELKLVFPQTGLMPEAVDTADFEHFYLQPMDGPNQKENTLSAVAYCKAHATWRLSLQSHKLIGLP